LHCKWPLALRAAGALASLAPPLFGLPLAAYVGVAALLLLTANIWIAFG